MPRPANCQFFFSLLLKISLVSPYLLFVSQENKISTDFEFGMGKRSCVKKGYMKDDYIHLFVRRPVRRSPIINRGMLQLSFSASLNSIYVSIYIYIYIVTGDLVTLLSCLAYVKVTLPVGLLFGSFFFNFWSVKETEMKGVNLRSRYYQLELVLIQHSFNCRCSSSVFFGTVIDLVLDIS